MLMLLRLVAAGLALFILSSNVAFSQNCKILSGMPIWNPYGGGQYSNVTYEWIGGCKDGLAEGDGIVKWYSAGTYLETLVYNRNAGLIMSQGKPKVSDVVTREIMRWNISRCDKTNSRSQKPNHDSFRIIEGNAPDAFHLNHFELVYHLLLTAEQIVWERCPSIEEGAFAMNPGKMDPSNIVVTIHQRGQTVIKARSYGNGYKDLLAQHGRTEFENVPAHSRMVAIYERWEQTRRDAHQRAQRAQEEEQRRQRAAAADAAKARLNQFKKRAAVEASVNLDELIANPFIYESKIIDLRSRFETMLSKDRALFHSGGNGFFVISAVPSGKFTHRSQTIIAARVVGKEQIDLPNGMKVLATHLKYVDAHICEQPECQEMIPSQ